MENLLGIHGQKTKKDLSKKIKQNKVSRTYCEKIIERQIIKKDKRFIKENLIEGIIYVIISLLFLMCFIMSFQKYKLIKYKNAIVNNYVSSNYNLNNSNL